MLFRSRLKTVQGGPGSHRAQHMHRASTVRGGPPTVQGGRPGKEGREKKQKRSRVGVPLPPRGACLKTVQGGPGCPPGPTFAQGINGPGWAPDGPGWASPCLHRASNGPGWAPNGPGWASPCPPHSPFLQRSRVAPANGPWWAAWKSGHGKRGA